MGKNEQKMALPRKKVVDLHVKNRHKSLWKIIDFFECWITLQWSLHIRICAKKIMMLKFRELYSLINNSFCLVLLTVPLSKGTNQELQ
jgi:hypothetical protein